MIAEVEAARNTAFAAPPRAESVSLSRQLLGKQLTRWHLSGLEDEAKLVLSELVTNAIIHGVPACGITVLLSADRRTLQITVVNVANGTVTKRSPSDSDENGRGLVLVGALAETWGIINTGTQVSVFANLKIPDQPGRWHLVHLFRCVVHLRVQTRVSWAG